MIDSIYTNMNDSTTRKIISKVELYNGSTLLKTFKHDDNLQSVEISRLGAKGKFFGFGICQQATVNIVDRNREINIEKGQVLKVYFSVEDENYVKICPSFYVDSVERDEKTNALKVIAYDAIYKAASHEVSELRLTAPYTVRDVAERITSFIGAEGLVIDNTITPVEPDNPDTPVTYTVTFNTNGHGDQPEAISNITTLPNPLPVLSEDGWTFEGWYKNQELTTIAVAGAMLYEDITLYAKWTEVVDPDVPVDPDEPTHTHTACPICGLCTDPDCTGTEEEKCQGHDEPEDDFVNLLDLSTCYNSGYSEVIINDDGSVTSILTNDYSSKLSTTSLNEIILNAPLYTKFMIDLGKVPSNSYFSISIYGPLNTDTNTYPTSEYYSTRGESYLIFRRENYRFSTIDHIEILFHQNDSAITETFTFPYIHFGYAPESYAVSEASTFSLRRSVAQENTGFDTEYSEGANFSGKETLRNTLDSIAEVTQTIYFLNDSEQLVFKSLDIQGGSVLNIEKNSYFDLQVKDAVNISKIVHVTELGNNLYTGDDTGIKQTVRDNPFWNNRTDLITLLDESLLRINGLTIVPFNTKWRGNFLIEIGDKIGLRAKDGSCIYTYVLDDIIKYNGGFSQTTNWEYTPEEDRGTTSNPTTIGEKFNQTFARVDQINKKIDLVVSTIDTKIEESIEKAVENIEIPDNKEYVDEQIKTVTETITEKEAAIKLTTDAIDQRVTENTEKTTTIENNLGEVISITENHTVQIGALTVESNAISASVKSLETTTESSFDAVDNTITALTKEVNLKVDSEAVKISINKALEEGVDKVKTSSKNYTFDDSGLNISSSDSEFNTEITEDGMRIYKHSTEVLIANNEGVTATDLHARTFLIIGENSRLEDRGNRTACFWIGPAGG